MGANEREEDHVSQRERKTMGWEDGHCQNLSGFEGNLAEPVDDVRVQAIECLIRTCNFIKES